MINNMDESVEFGKDAAVNVKLGLFDAVLYGDYNSLSFVEISEKLVI